MIRTSVAGFGLCGCAMGVRREANVVLRKIEG